VTTQRVPRALVASNHYGIVGLYPAPYSGTAVKSSNSAAVPFALCLSALNLLVTEDYIIIDIVVWTNFWTHLIPTDVYVDAII